MSIPRTLASFPIHGAHIRPAGQDSDAPARPTFSRKPSLGPAAPAQHVGRSQPAEPTPFMKLAQEMCTAGNTRYTRLKNHFHANPQYLGSANGADVFFNKDTQEIAVHDLNMKTGLRAFAEIFNINKEETTCVIKPDGRMYFNGQILTPDHPQAQEIVESLDKVCVDIHNYHNGLRPNKMTSLLVKPAWDPASKHHQHYVA
jgi:hypothetical protein